MRRGKSTQLQDKKKRGNDDLLAELESMVRYDPCHAEYFAFRAAFAAEEKTAEIAELLESVHALRYVHRELVPETVAYKDFWSRYFFAQTKQFSTCKLLGTIDKEWEVDHEQQSDLCDESSVRSDDEDYVRVTYDTGAEEAGAFTAPSHDRQRPMISLTSSHVCDVADDTTPICGICLEPAGSNGLRAEESQDVSPAAGRWQKSVWRLQECCITMRMRMNTISLPTCGHVHCKPCWEAWVKESVAEAARKGKTLDKVRCTLCKQECSLSAPTVSFLQLPQATKISSLLRRTLPTLTQTSERNGDSDRMTPLASSSQAQESRERAQRRRARENARLGSEELKEYHELRQEYGAVAANFHYFQRRGQRLANQSPWMKNVEGMQAALTRQARRLEEARLDYLAKR